MLDGEQNAANQRRAAVSVLQAVGRNPSNESFQAVTCAAGNLQMAVSA